MITTEGTEEEKGRVSKFIEPGISECKIASMEYTTSQKGTEGIKMIFNSHPVKELDNDPRTAETTLWFSEAGKKYALQKLVAFATALGVREQLDGIKAPDYTAYAKAIMPIIGNKFFRMKFIGKEIAGNKGNWWKAEVPFRSFVEGLTIPTENSKLTYDVNNEYDMVKLPKHDMDDMANAPATEVNDLPF
jgi:hypothetical protein